MVALSHGPMWGPWSEVMTEAPLRRALVAKLAILDPGRRDHFGMPEGERLYRGVMRRIWRRGGLLGALLSPLLRMTARNDTLFSGNRQQRPVRALPQCLTWRTQRDLHDLGEDFPLPGYHTTVRRHHGVLGRARMSRRIGWVLMAAWRWNCTPRRRARGFGCVRAASGCASEDARWACPSGSSAAPTCSRHGARR